MLVSLMIGRIRSSTSAVRPKISMARIVRRSQGGTSSHDSKSVTEQQDELITQAAQDAASKQTSTKTQAQQDEELMQKLSNMSDEGGEAGIEYEDGKPVAMKRGVKDHMFRIMPVRDHHM